MAKKDYYETLGVSKTATDAEIKSAFRKMAKQYHPDVNKEPGAAEKFKEISEAYSGFGQDDLEDIISSFFGGGSSKSRKASATKGEDSLVRINLTFDEAIFGCEKSFKISLNTMCQDCNGKGGLNPHTCSKCNGKGRIISQQRTLFGQTVVVQEKNLLKHVQHVVVPEDVKVKRQSH